MLVCLVHGYILFLKLRHMCDGLVKIDPIVKTTNQVMLVAVTGVHQRESC